MNVHSFNHKQNRPLNSEGRLLYLLGVSRFEFPHQDSQGPEKPVEREGGEMEMISQQEFKERLKSQLLQIIDAYKEREIRKQMKWEWDRYLPRLNHDEAFVGRQGQHRVSGYRGNFRFLSQRFTEHRGDYLQRREVFMAERRQMRLAFEEQSRAQMEAKVDAKLTLQDIEGVLDYATEQVFKSEAVAKRGSADIRTMLTEAYKILGDDIYRKKGDIPVSLRHLLNEFGEMRAPGVYKNGEYLGASVPRILRGRRREREGKPPPQTPFVSHADVENFLAEVRAQGQYTHYYNVFDFQYDSVKDPIAEGEAGSQAFKIAGALGLTGEIPKGHEHDQFMYEQLTAVLDSFEYRELQKDDAANDKPQIVEYNKEPPTMREIRRAREEGRKIDADGRRGTLILEAGEVVQAIEYSEINDFVEWYRETNMDIDQRDVFLTKEQQAFLNTNTFTNKIPASAVHYQFYSAREFAGIYNEYVKVIKPIAENVRVFSSGKSLENFADWALEEQIAFVKDFFKFRSDNPGLKDKADKFVDVLLADPDSENKSEDSPSQLVYQDLIDNPPPG